MDDGQDDKKKKTKKVAGGKSSNVTGPSNGAKESKTTKNGNFEVPQTSSK